MAKLHAADTEMTRHGFSLRPATYHLRVDYLLCRSTFLELGAGPELFQPTEASAAPLEWGLRWHVGFGFHFGCRDREASWSRNLSFAFQYRARAHLYGGGEPSHHTAMTGGLTYQVGRVAFSVLGTLPGNLRRADDYAMLGVKVSVGIGRIPR